MTLSPTFNEEERNTLYRIMAARRDIRHFLRDPIPDELLTKILSAAHMAPSVGYMQPWRFIRIKQTSVRQKIAEIVQKERLQTANALSERSEEFLKLKVEGINECGELIVVALMNHRETHIFGRRTMPEMDLASTACAIQNLWLAARAEGLGMGWVSLFDPDELAELLEIPVGATPVAILCLGYVKAFYAKPLLEEQGWAQRQNLDNLIYVDHWNDNQG